MFPPIEQLIPHRGSAVVISRVLSHADKVASCEALIEESSQYVRAGKAEAVLSLELAAQSVAALVALERREDEGPARLGYVIGVSEMRLTGGDFRVGDRLRVDVRLEFRDGPVGRFSFEIGDGSRLRARGLLTVYEPGPDAVPSSEETF